MNYVPPMLSDGDERDRRGRRVWRAGLALLAAVLLLKGMAWAIAIPPFDGPDEPGHFVRAQTDALFGVVPPSGSSSFGADVRGLRLVALGNEKETVPAVRYHVERASAGAVAPEEAALSRLKPSLVDIDTTLYGPLTYIPQAIAIRMTLGGGVLLEVLAARFASVVLGALTAVVVVWAAREAGLNRGMALAAGAVVGLEPMWSQQTAIVTADASLLLWTTLTIAFALRFLRTRHAGALLLASACALVDLSSKSQGLFVVPLLFPLYFVLFMSRQRFWQRLAALILGEVCIALGYIATTRFISGHRGIDILFRADWAGYLNHVAHGGFEYPLQLLDSAWWNFGWLEFTFGSPLRLGLRLVTLALVALVVLSILRPRHIRRSQAVLIAGAVLLVCVQLFGFDFQAWNELHATVAQGRYLLPALPPLVIGALAAVAALLPRRLVPTATTAVLTAAVLLNAAAFSQAWSRLYIG